MHYLIRSIQVKIRLHYNIFTKIENLLPCWIMEKLLFKFSRFYSSCIHNTQIFHLKNTLISISKALSENFLKSKINAKLEIRRINIFFFPHFKMEKPFLFHFLVSENYLNPIFRMFRKSKLINFNVHVGLLWIFFLKKGGLDFGSRFTLAILQLWLGSRWSGCRKCNSRILIKNCLVCLVN